MDSLPCLPQRLKGDQVRGSIRKGVCQRVVNRCCYQVGEESLRGSCRDGGGGESEFLFARSIQKDRTNNEVLRREDLQRESSDQKYRCSSDFLRLQRRESQAFLISRILL